MAWARGYPGARAAKNPGVRGGECSSRVNLPEKVNTVCNLDLPVGASIPQPKYSRRESKVWQEKKEK